MKQKLLLILIFVTICLKLSAYSEVVIDGAHYVYDHGGATVVSIDENVIHANIRSSVTIDGQEIVVTGLAIDAIYEVGHLTSICLPKTLSKIHFYNETTSPTESFTEIMVDEDNNIFSSFDGCLYNYEQTELIYVPSGRKSTPNMPKTTEVIAWPGFEHTAIKEITIPDGVRKIDGEACGSLYKSGISRKIKLPASVSNISSKAFFNSGGGNIVESIEVDKGNPKYYSKDGVLFERGDDGNILRLYPAKREKINYTITEDVTGIDYYAFYGNEYIHKLNIASRTLQMDEVNGTQSGAFNLLKNLQEIVVVNSKSSTLFSEDGVLFQKRDDGVSIISYPSGKLQQSYRIPDNVTTIENESFRNLYNHVLNVIHIPSSVVEIKDWAFREASSLVKIIFEHGIENPKIYSFGMKPTQSIYVPNDMVPYVIEKRGDMWGLVYPLDELPELMFVTFIPKIAYIPFNIQNITLPDVNFKNMIVTVKNLDVERIMSPTSYIDDVAKFTIGGLIPYIDVDKRRYDVVIKYKGIDGEEKILEHTFYTPEPRIISYVNKTTQSTAKVEYSVTRDDSYSPEVYIESPTGELIAVDSEKEEFILKNLDLNKSPHLQ